MIPVAERVLMQVWWTDTTNVAGGWHDADDLTAFAANGAWEATNTGWLVWEDAVCYVLAGRMTDDGKNVGLIERVPKRAVTRVQRCCPDSGVLTADDKASAFAARHGSFALHFDSGRNYGGPDGVPWTLILDGGENQAWGALTAGEAIDLAASELDADGERCQLPATGARITPSVPPP